LGGLQGLTEFLPISSSGHLILGEELLGLEVEMLKSFDVTVHVATLLAVLFYFRRDIWEMLKALGRLLSGKLNRDDYFGKLVLFIIIGTIPAVIIGLFFGDAIDTMFRNVKSVGGWMLVVGLVFLLGELTYKRLHADRSLKEKIVDGAVEGYEKVRGALQPGYENIEMHKLNWKKALVIGLAQSVALIPGVSRSGSTIVAGLFQGIDRTSAARFSFLLSIPAILGAALLTFLDNGSTVVSDHVGANALLIGFISSFAFGLASIAFLMHFLKKHTLMVFAIYLIALGMGVMIS